MFSCFLFFKNKEMTFKNKSLIAGVDFSQDNNHRQCTFVHLESLWKYVECGSSIAWIKSKN